MRADKGEGGMQNKIPRFRYDQKAPFKNTFGCLKLGNKVVHTIVDLDKFYKQLGYTPAMAMKGILPEAFVWDTFFRYGDRNCGSCYQLRIIEYLLSNSMKFVEKYATACDEWISFHAGKRMECKVSQCDDRKL